MSYNIRNIREIATDPTTKVISHLAKKISDFANAQQTEELENKEDIYSTGQDVDSVLRFHTLTSNKKFVLNTIYYPPFEPDFNNVRIFIKARNTGEHIDDWSGEDNKAFIHGEPMLIDGTPFDDGISTGGFKSLALRFNRPTSLTQNEEYLDINHNTRNRASEGLATGVSYFIRFRPLSLSQQGGSDRRLFEKTDNNPITDGVQARVSTGGAIKFQIRNSNVDYIWKTNTGVITTNTVYDVWFTYAKSGNVVKIYINGVEQSLTTDTLIGWHSDLTNQDLYIFRRGAGTGEGYMYADLYDFRQYRERVVSQTEITRMNTNKWTIYDIPFGQVMVADYYSTTNYGGGGAGSGGYDSTGYDSTGFDTT